MICRLLACSCALAVLAVLAAGAGPAYADDEVGLSIDGRVWTNQLDEPLFARDFRWVPGDVEAASFVVRNQGPSDAEMTVAVVSADPDALLARGDLALAARVRDSAWIPLVNGEPSRPLSSAVVARGARTRVDVRVTFRSGSRNRSQADRLPLSFRVTLTDERAGTAPVPGTPTLPGTGSAVEPWLVWLAFGLIGSGLALLVARRRPDRDRDREGERDSVMAHG